MKSLKPDFEMTTGRLEAFSDGVLAIIITIMVLEMEAPKGFSFRDLLGTAPVFFSYLGSFIYLGIYWNNHHHLMQVTKKVNGKILWANLNLLFWLSLFPFATAWMGESYFEKDPVALYGLILFMAAVAYKLLAYFVKHSEGENSVIWQAYHGDLKGNISVFLYAVGTLCAFFLPWLSLSFYIGVAVFWFVPDKRIEKSFLE